MEGNKMKQKDFENAKELQAKIQGVEHKIALIAEIREVKLVNTKSMLVPIDDIKEAMDEEKCKDGIDSAQASFLVKLTLVLEEYRIRLLKEFDEI